MSKLATLRLDGDLEQGVSVLLTIVTLQFSGETSQGFETEHPFSSSEISGELPPNVCLANTIEQWQSNYRSLGAMRMQVNQVTYDASIHQECLEKCKKLKTELRSQLNEWLESNSFWPIRDKWLEQLKKVEVRVLIRTSDRSLLKLPWQLWDLVEDNLLAEVAFGTLDAEPVIPDPKPTLRGKVRILAILGDSTGINVEEDRKLLEGLPDAETIFLVEPSRGEINDRLWEQDWDILYFAGHSRTEREQGIIDINKNESLTIEDLRHSVRNAVDRGLKLAIFNSCDGMGLAFKLQELHLPQVIVMREPVPDRIAQEFLRYFLPAYTNGQSLYLAERKARERLQGREDEFPGASWLPVIFQSPATTAPTWLDLGHRPTQLCPYRGLFAFREEDAMFFHGREKFTQTLLKAIQGGELFSTIGASGSGKSSVVFAGLVPKLRQQGSWEIVAFRPGQRPFQAIASAWIMLRDSNQSQVEQLAEAWHTDRDALHTTIDTAVQESPGTKLLFIVDQFEELYTQCQDIQERQAFIDSLLKVVELPNVALVLTLRADFLGQALAYPPLADVLNSGNRMLGAMSDEELQAAISKPAALLGVTFEEGLTDSMIKAVSRSERNLPLLEFALEELWKKRQGTLLTHAAYREIGGLEAAMTRHVDKVYNGLSDSEKERSRQIFIQLVRPGEGTVDTRRVATRAEIGDKNWALVTRLASDRLVVTGQNPIDNSETVELVHEALITEWSCLQRWMATDRVFRAWQERLRGAMRQWQEKNQDAAWLLRGAALAEAEEQWRQRPEELDAESDFIKHSLQSARWRKIKEFVLYFIMGSVVPLSLWLIKNVADTEYIMAKMQNQYTFFIPEPEFAENDKRKDYYYDLLRLVLREAYPHKTIEIKTRKIDTNQGRKTDALNRGEIDLQNQSSRIKIDINWMVQNNERNALARSIDFPLTLGLISHRLCLMHSNNSKIHKASNEDISTIRNKNLFIKQVHVTQVKYWPDLDFLKSDNDIKLSPTKNYDESKKQLLNNNVNCFLRGLNEIYIEQEQLKKEYPNDNFLVADNFFFKYYSIILFMLQKKILNWLKK